MNRFKSLREIAGLKQIEVAQKLEIRQTTVSMWESGKSHPHAALLPKLATLYNCTIDQLLASPE